MRDREVKTAGGRLARGRARFPHLAIAAFLTPIFGAVGGGLTAAAAETKTVAFLGVQFLNDHEDLEPTTDAERSRVDRGAIQVRARSVGSIQVCADAGRRCGENSGEFADRHLQWL
jgi:hypothetical protein